MRLRSALIAMAAAALAPASAFAELPIHLACQVQFGGLGEQQFYNILIDLEHGAVQQGKLHFVDGGPTVPVPVDTLGSFVRRDGNVVSWGSVDKTDETPNTTTSVDLTTGAYTSDIGGRIHGHCTPDSI